MLVAVALGALVIVIVWKCTSANESYPPYAPGRLPVIGHLHHLAGKITVQELFRRWSLQKGPIFTVQLGVKRWVILNSMDAVNKLIVERSTVYSSRNLPDTLVNDLFYGVSNGGGFAFYPYGKEWRFLRRIAHNVLVLRKIDLYQPIIDERRNTLIKNIWDASSKHDHQKALQLTMFIEHYTMTTILAIAFGKMCSFTPGDPKLHEAFALTERSAALLGPSEQIREFFPVLNMILPSARAEFIDVRRKMSAFYGGLLEEFKAQSDPDDCFVKEVLAKGELTDLQIATFVTLFVGAGSETTASTLEWMIALLANHPEIQDKAYNEIKEAVGLDHLPTHEDESLLPYLQCIILETLRLRPPAPLSVPHATSEDDVYQNWFIPANTTVIMNLHAIHQDPSQYPEPEKFIPERHMSFVETGSKKFSQTTKDRPHLAFSTGRRVCVGIHLAERSLFMAASALVSCFKFEREGDDLVNVKEPRDIRSPTFAPLPYKVRIVRRQNDISII